jgi:hypothetical protein
MTSRPIKMVVVLLVGFALAWQGVFATSARIGVATKDAKKSCCRTGCDSKHCSTPACCVKPESPAAPVAPASLPSTTQNEFQALAATLVSLFTLSSRPASELPARDSSSVSVTAIPLFQRDCSYLV